MNMKSLSSMALPAVFTAACTFPTAIDPNLLGSPAPPTAATRSIVVTPDTRWVNVTGGEIVRFVVADNTFTWNFNNSPTVSSFDLRQVAPAGLFDHQVEAYVAPNPLYIGGERRGGHGAGHAGGHR